MYQKLDTVTLRSGETVEAGVVTGPDPAWAERLVKLLWHKGDPWNWQNAQVLERDLGLDVFFYVLEGEPTIEIGEEREKVMQDSIVESPANHMHCIYNETDKTARFLVVKFGKK